MTTPGAGIVLATLPNLRDLGGWPTVDGHRVRRGLLFRSTELGRIDEGDSARLAELGIRCVFDLRTAPERAAKPDRLPAGVAGVVADVLADAPQALPAELETVMNQVELVQGFLASGEAERFMTDTYRDLVRLPSALAAYRSVFAGVLEPDGLPTLLHCTTGKDRTGWGSAVLLTLLGVAEDDVYRDYLLTNEQLLPALAPIFDAFAARGGEREKLSLILGVDRRYLDAAFAELRERYGTVEAYFADGLGIDAAQQQRLRELLLEPAG